MPAWCEVCQADMYLESLSTARIEEWVCRQCGDVLLLDAPNQHEHEWYDATRIGDVIHREVCPCGAAKETQPNLRADLVKLSAALKSVYQWNVSDIIKNFGIATDKAMNPYRYENPDESAKPKVAHAVEPLVRRRLIDLDE